MDIKIFAVKMQKEQGDVGYVAKFANIHDESEQNYTLPVAIGSYVDGFLTRSCDDNYIKLAVVDGRIIALINEEDNIQLVRDVILEGFKGREAEANIKYIEKKYGISVEQLEVAIKEAIKDFYLDIIPVKVSDESYANSEKLVLILSNEKEAWFVACPRETEQGAFVLKIAKEENNMIEALKKIGREMYLITYGGDIVAIADKNTKDICVLRVCYSLCGDSETNLDIIELEKRRGIEASTLDVRIKRLIDKE